MNHYANLLKLTSSHFDSPHGLMNVANLSTAYDMARLAAKCMQIPIFKRIVSTKEFHCKPVKATSTDMPPMANLKGNKKQPK